MSPFWETCEGKLDRLFLVLFLLNLLVISLPAVSFELFESEEDSFYALEAIEPSLLGDFFP